MDDNLLSEIAAIASDSRSGATAILARAVAVLRGAAADRPTLEQAAVELCRAQPSMAGLRVAASLARRAADPVAALDGFVERTARAPRVIARHAAALLKLRQRTGALRIVTCSQSHAVEEAIRTLAQDVPVEVSCAEGRPALEGRALAATLAEANVRVTIYTDAGVATAILGAEAFVVGADAIGPRSFINKVGTGALAALAAVHGVPTYVLAGREKILTADAFGELQLRSGSADEIWPSPPLGVQLANPYFEPIDSSSVAAFVTDAGVVPPEGIAEFAII